MKAKHWKIAALCILGAIGLLAVAAIGLMDIIQPSTTAKWEQQWLASGHNFDPASFGSAATSTGCIKCHDSASFVSIQTKGEDPPAENLAAPAEYGHTCKTCHALENAKNILQLRMVGNVTLPAYGDVVSGGVSASCMACHNGRRENPEEYVLTSFRGTHEGPQSDMLSGTGAITYGETFGSSIHTSLTQCVTCHKNVMPAENERGHSQVGGHSFAMRWDGGTPNNPKDDVINVAACQQCHTGIDTFDIPAKGDYDGDGTVEGVQTEVEGLLTLVASELPQDEDGNVSIPTDLSLTTVEQRMANFNYTFVYNDGSHGIHNPAYTVQVLRKTYEQLTGSALGGDTLTGGPFVAAHPTTSASTTLRAEQWENSPHSFDPTDPAVLEEFSGAPENRSCVQCHNSEWFVRIQVNGEEPPPENLAEPPAFGHTCSTCHAAVNDETNALRLHKTGEVTLPAYGDVVDAGISAACMSCHNARRVNPPEYAATSFRGAHGGPQADMLSGTGAVTYGQTFRSSSHIVAVEKKCAGCHMYPTPAEGQPGHNLVGSHALNLRYDNGTPDTLDDDVEHVAACQGCHQGVTTFDFPADEDFDGNGVVEGVQTEVKGMLAKVASALPNDGEGNVSIQRDLSLTTVEQRRAYFNYTLVANDGSYGVHNFNYAVDMLRASYRQLTGENISEPPKDYSNVFFARLERGLNMVSLPLESLTPYSARQMLEELDATVVIKMDAAKQQFVGFTADDTGDGFAIEGSKGYIVNVTTGKDVSFTGAAWTNDPIDLAAPGVAVDSAWAFVVGGVVADENHAQLAKAYTLSATNRRTGETAVSSLNAHGQFGAVWADLSRKSVVESGDRIEVVVKDSSGTVVSEPITVSVDPEDLARAYTRLRLVVPSAPKATRLAQNYPNPFNPETWIPFQLSESAHVTIQIYSLNGELVRALDLGMKPAGYYMNRSSAAYWDGTNFSGERVSSGTYFYHLQAEDYSAVRKMIILK